MKDREKLPWEGEKNTFYLLNKTDNHYPVIVFIEESKMYYLGCGGCSCCLVSNRLEKLIELWNLVLLGKCLKDPMKIPEELENNILHSINDTWKYTNQWVEQRRKYGYFTYDWRKDPQYQWICEECGNTNLVTKKVCCVKFYKTLEDLNKNKEPKHAD